MSRGRRRGLLEATGLPYTYTHTLTQLRDTRPNLSLLSSPTPALFVLPVLLLFLVLGAMCCCMPLLIGLLVRFQAWPGANIGSQVPAAAVDIDAVPSVT